MIRFIRYRCDNKWCNCEYSPISLYITFDVGYNLIYPYPVGSLGLVLYLDYDRLPLTFLRHRVKKEGLPHAGEERGFCFRGEGVSEGRAPAQRGYTVDTEMKFGIDH